MILIIVYKRWSKHPLWTFPPGGTLLISISFGIYCMNTACDAWDTPPCSSALYVYALEIFQLMSFMGGTMVSNCIPHSV